jgi:transcription antitermination factor NusG
VASGTITPLIPKDVSYWPPHISGAHISVPGVIRILGNGDALTPVPTDEIESIRRAVASGLPVEPFDLLRPGEPVQVQTGPLAGIKGEVVYHKGKHRLLIRVSALNHQAVSVEVDYTNVARLASFAFERAPVSRSQAIQ